MSSPPVLKTRPPAPVTLRPLRSLKNITADAVIEETGLDEMVITQHPVEEGSTISDHAFRKPAELTLVYIWSMASEQNNDQEGLTFLNSLYLELLQLKDERIPFKVITGKRSYQNMLIQSLQQTTDHETENVLLIRIICQEVIITTTQVIQISDAANHAMPEKTAPVVNQGQVQLQPGTNFNGDPNQ